jgi:hypothetical protein
MILSDLDLVNTDLDMEHSFMQGGSHSAVVPPIASKSNIAMSPSHWQLLDLCEKLSRLMRLLKGICSDSLV